MPVVIDNNTIFNVMYVGRSIRVGRCGAQRYFFYRGGGRGRDVLRQRIQPGIRSRGRRRLLHDQCTLQLGPEGKSGVHGAGVGQPCECAPVRIVPVRGDGR